MAALTRLLVIGSTLLGVAAGLWPLQSQPGILAALAAVFLGTLGLARWQPGAATVFVFAFAYVSYGVVRLLAGPAVAGMPFFLATFAGLTLGVVSWTRWQSPMSWRVPLAWWALGVSLSWPYVALRELGFSLGPSLAAGQIVTAALLQLSLALWMDFLLSDPDGWQRRRRDELPVPAWRVPLIVSALATSAAALYQQWVDPSWLSGEPWIGLGRAVGLQGDANPMGVITAMWAPLTIGAMATSAASAFTGVVLAMPIYLAAWASGSRTMVILLAAGAAALGLLATGALGWSRRRVILGGAAIAAVSIVLAVTLAPRLPASSPVARVLQNSVSGRSPGAALYELLWHRDGYGAGAAIAIKEHPIFGVGIGRFWGLAPVYVPRVTGFAVAPDNAQNLWRQTLVEQGIVGLLPVAWLTVLTLAALFRGRAEGFDLVVRVMVLGLGAGLLVGYPVQDPAVAMTLATLVCAVARQSRD